jgi:hypothetical protein
MERAFLRDTESGSVQKLIRPVINVTCLAYTASPVIAKGRGGRRRKRKEIKKWERTVYK